MFPSIPVAYYFYQEWMLNFVNFFSVSVEIVMRFLFLESIDVLNYVDGFFTG